MTWPQPALRELLRLLAARTGLSFAPERLAGVEKGSRRAMKRAGIDDPVRYLRLIESEAGALDALVSELTVGESYFFREPAQFRFLRQEILPALVGAPGRHHLIRAWSAGCASGEEAYSLAIVLAEQGLAGRSHVLATDISRPALARAQQARYGAWSLRGQGLATARPYLRQEENQYLVSELIRRLVTVSYLNLAEEVYPSAATGTCDLDLILCRNVLIYFGRERVRSVAGRLYESLADGGWLLTASTDPPLGDLAPFETVATDKGMFYRRGAPPTAGQTVGLTDADRQAIEPTATGAWTALPAPPVEMAWEPELHVRRGDRALPSAREGIRERSSRSGPDEPGPGPDVAAILAAARDDLARGHYERAAERTRALGADAQASALHIRALANLDLAAAVRACTAATARHPLSGELHYLRAMLLIGQGRDDEALRAIRRALYLDRSLIVGHFTLGTILRRRGDRAGASRALRNALALCAARPPEEIVPLADGETAGQLAEAARAQMAQLGEMG